MTFKATHSFFLSTNYRPMVEETDLGTWRRLCLVRFPYTFRKTEEEVFSPEDILGDPTLRARCESDPDVWAAALTWMVEGARRWYEANRVMPEDPMEVEIDTWKWREESDQVLSYLEDRIKFDADRHIAATDLLGDMNDWLKARGQHPWSDKTLASRFGDHDVVSSWRVTPGRVRHSEKVSRPGNASFFDPNPYHFSEPSGPKPLPGAIPGMVGHPVQDGCRYGR